MKKLLLSYILITACFATGLAVAPADSARLAFRQSQWKFDGTLDGNHTRVEELVRNIEEYTGGPDARFSVSGVEVVGGASPEGSVEINKLLSLQRAATIFNYINSNTALPDSMASFTYLGRDWSGLRELVERDGNVPYRNEVLALLAGIVDETATGEQGGLHTLERLKVLRGGVPYAYMYSQLFPLLRESRLYVSYALRRPAPRIPEQMPVIETSVIDYVPEPLALDAAPEHSCRPFYMGLKTNMLYDALALPSIGAEFYVGKNISLVANWTYGWWDKDHVHRYWRAYGGDMAARWWFGRKAHEKPLTGHHLGVYAGVLTFDFEWGGTGYMGGIPGGTLWDRCMVNGGIEYGYSLPVGRRLNIDFTIGIGVLSGKYVKYVPSEAGYLWQSTRHVNWVGPTKAEISLVWLIGCGNYNSRKGGQR